MDLNKLIEQKIHDCRLYGVTKPSIIKEILKIPDEINIKTLDQRIDDFYDTFYIKKTWAEETPTKEQRLKNYLNIEKNKAEKFHLKKIVQSIEK